VIDLSSTHLNPGDCMAILDVCDQFNLRTLDLSSIRLSNLEIERICGLIKNSGSLRELFLANCGLQNKELLSLLTAISQSSSMEVAVFSDNFLSLDSSNDQSLWLKSILQSRHFKLIDLQYCGIHDRNIATQIINKVKLLQEDGCLMLDSLNVTGNTGFSAEDVSFLRELKSNQTPYLLTRNLRFTRELLHTTYRETIISREK
jgi:Ran GTPase-activating protein (RanGAP) involved in mRNA processing and transport